MKDSADPQSGSRRLFVMSIGRADAAAAGALAKGLSIAPELAARCLYRAPAPVADNLDHDVADQMQRLLEQLGLETRVVGPGDPVPAPPDTLYDVAVYLSDAALLPEVARDLAGFLGATPVQAIAMLSTPPGVVLGQVSDATVAALRARLERPGLELVASDKARAAYGLITDAMSPVHLSGLERDLAAAGRDMDAPGTFGWEAAERLWRRHRPAGLRIVDMAFLRYDILLTGWADSAGARAMLSDRAGMPAGVIDAVVADLPVALEEGVTEAAARAALDAYDAAGLSVAADPVSFQTLSAQVTRAARPGDLAAALVSVGLWDNPATPPELPWQSPPLTELQARFAELVLTRAGATLSLQEVQP